MNKTLISALRLTLCVSIVGFGTVLAQEKRITKNDVPAPVISAFEQAFPKAVIRGYAKEVEGGKTYYEIESMDGKTSRDILYLADGTTSEIEESLASAELPASVKTAVTAKYPKSEIAKAERTTRGSEVTYELKLTTKKGKVSMTLDPNGKVLKEHSATPPR